MKASSVYRIFDNDRPLDIEAVAARFPTLSQVNRHDSRSERFAPIPTIDTVRALVAQGFNLHSVQIAHVRNVGRHGYERHMLRLRSPTFGYGDETAEVIACNANDGTSSWLLTAGIYRYVCCNGIIVGSDWASARVTHTGDVTSKVINATYTVVDQFDKVAGTVDAMKSRMLSADEQYDFANRAAILRFGDTPTFSPTVLAIARRGEDTPNTLWHTFNRIQENTTRGGLVGRLKNGRKTTTREVTGISANLRLQRGLFDIAQSYLAA